MVITNFFAKATCNIIIIILLFNGNIQYFYQLKLLNAMTKIEIPRTMTEVMQDIDYNVQLLDMFSKNVEKIKKALMTDIVQLRSQLDYLEDSVRDDNLNRALEISRPRRVKRVVK